VSVSPLVPRRSGARRILSRHAFLPLALLAAAALRPALARAQAADTVPEPPASHHALQLTVGGVGLTLGNSRTATGIRINAVDHQVERVTGLNLTLWKPRANPDLVVTGVAAGLVGPRAKRIDGIALGGIGVMASEQLNGVSAGGLIVLSRNEINGVAVGGVAAVAAQRLRGVGLGGLFAVGDHGIDGLAAAGLVTLSEGDVHGITAAGVGTIEEGRFTGINVAGVATFTDGEMRGLNAAGVAAVVRGRLQGIGLAAGTVKVSALDGVAVSAWNNVRGEQRGLTIGIFNYAQTIHGLQLGLLNYVRSNPKGLRLLPVFNTGFGGR
jgi:hypothetical protein